MSVSSRWRGLSGGTRIAAVALALVMAALVLLALLPWGLVAGRAAGTMSAALGRPVSVGSARRIGWFGLVPEIALSDIRIDQPAWAGRGGMATIREARLRFPVLPLLVGRFRVRSLAIDGLHVALFRDANGRSNWEGDDGDRRRPGGAPSIRDLTIRGGTVTLDDRRRHARLLGRLAADANGVTVVASGTLHDRPLRLAVRGGTVGALAHGRPWPLHIVARSPLVDMDAVATLAGPLDLARFTAHVAASGQDLTYLDDLVQAGLFPTQSFRLTGNVRRDRDDWHITELRAQVGRSKLVARADVARADGRVRIDSSVDAATFAFDDFESDAQRARGAAKARATGDRIIPGTRLQLDGLRKLDGTVRLTAHRVLVASGSPFRALRTTATIDRQRLVLDPLELTLATGTATGRLIDDDRQGTPRVDLDLRLGGGATIDGLLTRSGSIRGPMEGHLRLVGEGDGFRSAMARASGVVGFAVPRGTTRRDYATFAGGDVGKSVGAAISGTDDRTALRCVVGRFVARNGRLTPQPLVIDTAVSRADGRGSIDLATETLNLTMIGRPKNPGLLVSTAPTRVTGTLSHPELDIRPPRARDNAATGVLARVGYFLKGLRVRTAASKQPPAAAADCPALIRAALR